MDNRATADIIITSPFFSGNCKALFMLLLETDLASRTCWLSQSLEEFESLNKLGFPVAFWTTDHGHQHTWRMLQKSKLVVGSDVTFVLNLNDSFDLLTARSKKLNLWHGSPWKNIGEQSLLRHTVFSAFLTMNNFLENSDYFLVPDAQDLEKMEQILPNARFIQAIEPKWLSLLEKNNQTSFLGSNGRKTKLDLHVEYNESKSRRVLWAPTYRETENTWTAKLIQDFLEMSERFEVEIVIKPHHWDSYLPQVLNGLGVRYVEPTTDIYPLLPIFDFIVTDYSSLLVELKSFHFPCASYAFDISAYESRHGFLSNVIDKEYTLVTSDLNELFSEILGSKKSGGHREEFKSLKKTWLQIIHQLIN
jgi:CDP-glycerol glycerophosphotransferase (TagB/SpsB family)